MTSHLNQSQTLLWMRSMPTSLDLDERIVLIRRKSRGDIYSFFVGILMRNTGGYVILYSYGDVEMIVSPEEVEWALL